MNIQSVSDLFSLDFWITLFERFQAMGPLMPILLAAVESLIPPLPLFAIVTMNVASHGPVKGFIYSWVGTCIGCTCAFLFYRLAFMRLFKRFCEKHPRILKARLWVEETNTVMLFMLALMPFTPSAFLNFAFGISEFPIKVYLPTLFTAKLSMIGLLALIGQSFVSAMKNPWMILLGIALLVVTYILSKKVSKHGKIDSI